MSQVDPNDGVLSLATFWRPRPNDPNPEIPGEKASVSLYLPVKRFLERRGFQVKGEIGNCDLVALSPDSPPIVVIGELKLAFNLELVLQGVDRAGACDEVWLAVRSAPNGSAGRRRPMLRMKVLSCKADDTCTSAFLWVW